MRYLIAILLPPLGMLSVGKVLDAFVCLLLMFTIVGHPIAAIWAVLVVNPYRSPVRYPLRLANIGDARGRSSRDRGYSSGSRNGSLMKSP